MDLQATVTAIVAMISVAYVFAKVSEKHGFTRGLLAVSVTIDFYLFIMWLLGINRPIARICSRLGCMTLSAISIALPIKLLFTAYLFVKTESLKRILG